MSEGILFFRLFDDLIQFTTSKVVHEICESCERVTRQHNTSILEKSKIMEKLKHGWKQSLVPRFLSRKKNSTSRQKLYKSRYQSFLFFPVLLDFSTLFHQFCARLLGKGARLKTTALLVIFLFLKLVHNRHLDHLENCGIFSDF